MAAPSLTSPSMSPTNAAATTPAGCRPPQLSGSSRRARISATKYRRVGVANSVPDLLPAGGHRDLHPAPTPGDADLPGDQGQGADDQEPVEGSLPQLQHQVRADRLHRADRT